MNNNSFRSTVDVPIGQPLIMILFFLLFLKQSAISQMEKDLKQRAQEVRDREKEVEYFTPNSF